VLLVNSDIVVLPGSIDLMADYLEQHLDVGMVTCKLVYPDGRPQNSCLNFPTLLSEFSDLTHLQRRYPRSPIWAHYTMAGWNHGETRDVEQPMASFVMVRREVLDRVGYFDPRFPIYYNDVDWCLRIRHAGWRIVYLAEARVIHHRRATTDRLGGWRIVEHHRGKRTFYRKHYGRLGHGLVWFLNVSILCRRYVKLRALRRKARRQSTPFAKKAQLWETAKLLRMYLGLRLGS
jgi:GT2 family glycosyltransferase